MNKHTFTVTRFIYYAVCILLFITIFTSSSYASMPIGTKIGEVLSTDIIATIDEKPVPSMNINGYTAIVVEDLRAYGFQVIWNEHDRTLKVTRNEMKEHLGKEFLIQRMEPGAVLKPVLFTDIQTYLDGKEIISFNIDGQTAIYFNQLKPYGDIQWSESSRVASFAFPLPVIIPEPITTDAPDNTVVSRRATQLDPEDSLMYHKPIDKASMPKNISVGLFYNDTALNSLTVSSVNGFNVGTFNDDFNVVFSISDGQQMMMAPDRGYYIAHKNVFNNASQAQEMSKNLVLDNIDAVIVHDMKGWNVYIGPYGTHRDAEDGIDMLDLNQREWTAMGTTSNVTRISNSQNKTVFLYHDNAPLYISDLSNDINDSVIQIGNAKYRGAVTALSNTDKRLTVINRLSIEQYLYGVVPREMPATWHIEALKAQAVAARGFALANIGKYHYLGFDMCNTVNSQVYGGYDSEKSAASKAVDATYGKVMSANGELVIPYYHSNSGGQTESSENVWTEAVSYVRGVYDPYSLDAPHAEWQERITFDELEARLIQNRINIGKIIDIHVNDVSANGRVLQVDIIGTQGSYTAYKQESRWVFGLKSNYYDLMIQNNDVLFNGYGYGHGVGMSQHGANVMAESGYSWQQILAHYFTGIHVE